MKTLTREEKELKIFTPGGVGKISHANRREMLV